MKTTSKKAYSRKSLGSTLVVKKANGKRSTFKKVGCHSTKTAAKQHAAEIRRVGMTARIKKIGTATCVFKGPKAKKPFGGKRRHKAA